MADCLKHADGNLFLDHVWSEYGEQGSIVVVAVLRVLHLWLESLLSFIAVQELREEQQCITDKCLILRVEGVHAVVDEVAPNLTLLGDAYSYLVKPQVQVHQEVHGLVPRALILRFHCDSSEGFKSY